MGHFVKTLRMAGHDQPLHRVALFGRQGLPCLQPQGFFAIAAAGQQCYRTPCSIAMRLPALPQGLALLQQGGVGRGIELEVAGHHHRRDAQRLQPLRILGGLCVSYGQAAVALPGQLRQALPLAQGFFTEPGIGQGYRHALLAAGLQQLGPDFGFHD